MVVLYGILKFLVLIITIYVGLGLGFFMCFVFMNYDVKMTDNKTGEVRRPKGLEKIGICFLAGMLWILGVWQSRGED